jgi:uncharacterized OB-fold protein
VTEPVHARTVPEPSEISQPFWDASREQRLVLQRCPHCDRAIWYPRAMCPRCLSEELEWSEASGNGTVYAMSVHHRAPAAELADRVPYVVALVDLDEGVRLMTNVVGVEPAAVRVGQRVQATWEPLADGRHLLLFNPLPSSPLLFSPKDSGPLPFSSPPSSPKDSGR